MQLAEAAELLTAVRREIAHLTYRISRLGGPSLDNATQQTLHISPQQPAADAAAVVAGPPPKASEEEPSSCRSLEQQPTSAPSDGDGDPAGVGGDRGKVRNVAFATPSGVVPPPGRWEAAAADWLSLPTTASGEGTMASAAANSSSGSVAPGAPGSRSSGDGESGPKSRPPLVFAGGVRGNLHIGEAKDWEVSEPVRLSRCIPVMQETSLVTLNDSESESR